MAEYKLEIYDDIVFRQYPDWSTLSTLNLSESPTDFHRRKSRSRMGVTIYLMKEVESTLMAVNRYVEITNFSSTRTANYAANLQTIFSPPSGPPGHVSK